jgi:hypothetical protein
MRPKSLPPCFSRLNGARPTSLYSLNCRRSYAKWCTNLSLVRTSRIYIDPSLITTSHNPTPCPPSPLANNSPPTKEPASITLVTKSVPAALLATCRQINHETLPYFESLLAVLQEEPNRFIVDNEAVHIFDRILGFVDKSLNENAYVNGLSPGMWQFIMKLQTSVDTATANAFLAKCFQCLASAATSSPSQLRFRQTIVA